MALDAQRPVVTNHHCSVMPPRERPTGQELGALKTREPAQEANGNDSGKPPLSPTSHYETLIFPKHLLGLREMPPTFGVPDRDLRREIQKVICRLSLTQQEPAAVQQGNCGEF